MKVKIPREFKVGATPAKVYFQKNLSPDEGFNGTFNKRTGRLCIDSELIGAKRDKTFGHELSEVIKENYDLDISEHTMTTIANGWLEFLYELGIEFIWDDIPTC